MKLRIDGKKFSVNLAPCEEGYIVSLNNKKIKTSRTDKAMRAKDKLVTSIHKTSDHTYNVCVNHDHFHVELMDVSAQFKHLVRAPMEGIIISVDVKKDQKVMAGQTLVRILSMKMENEIKAEKDCVVKKIKVKNKQTVEKGDLLIELKKEKK